MARRGFRFRGRRLRRTGFRRVFRSFRKKVGRVLFRMSETKQAVRNINFPISAASGAFSVVQFPQIPVGPADYQRVGNRIFSKRLQIKMAIQTVTAAASASYGAWLRVYWVWPRKLSTTDALAQATQTNFPVFGLMDQDNWIVFRDTYAMPISETLSGYFAVPWKKKLEFNKKWPCMMEYKDATTDIANKTPLLIFSSTLGSDLNHVINILGYVKVSYKDI